MDECWGREGGEGGGDEGRIGEGMRRRGGGEGKGREGRIGEGKGREGRGWVLSPACVGTIKRDGTT